MNIKKNQFLNDGRKCFIIGTAPAVKDLPFKLLGEHVTIGVNLILHSGFVPNYICVSDKDMIADNYNAIIDKRMANRNYVIVRPKDETTMLKLQQENNVHIVSSFKTRGTGERFPYIDPSLKAFAITKNGVINDLAIPFAIYLGFKEIYLLGVGGYHGAQTHFYDIPDLKSKDDYFESVVRSGKEPVTYELMQFLLQETDVRLYNCASPTVHKELEYRSLEEVLN